MKVTVIGYWGGYPEKDGATSCYLIEEKNFKVLIDCGSGALASLQNYVDPKSINCVIISHYHHDHIADIGVLQYYKIINTGLESGVLPIYGHKLDEEKFASLTHKKVTMGYEYQENEPLNLGPITIQFKKTIHPVDCFAMRIESRNSSVVYTADSSYMEEFITFSKDADLLICDCNMYENQDGTKAGHMSSKEVGTIAEQAKVKSLLLSHLPHSGELNHLLIEAKKYYNGPIHLAHTGYVWKSMN